MEEKKEEVKNAESPKDSGAAAELAKVRSNYKVFKIIAIVLSSLFVLLLCAAFLLYQKFSFLREFLMPQTETMQDSAFRVGEEGVPGTRQAGIKKFEQPAPAPGQSSLTVFTNAKEYADEPAAITAEDGIAATRVFEKYSDRPIVKDFLAELKKDPDFAKAIKAKDANNPMAMISSIQNAKTLQSVALKFSARKDFMPFMMEVMSDPALKPLISKLPMGNMGPGAQIMKVMAGSAPAPAPVVEQPEKDAPPETGTGEPAQLDSSAMQNPAPSAGTGIKKKTPPPPGE